MDLSAIDLTLHLTVMFGAYLTAAGILCVTSKDAWTNILADLEASSALTFLTGFVVFSLGAVLIHIHNRWDSALESAISLIGWAAFIKGLVFIAAPKLMFVLANPFAKPQMVRAFGALILLGGLALIAIGLTG